MKSLRSSWTKLRLLILPVIALSIVACEKPKNTPANNIKRVTGDPIVFVKGTQTNGDTGGFPEEIFEKGGRWAFYTNGFVQRELVSYEEKVSEQTPVENAEENEERLKFRETTFLDSNTVLLKDNAWSSEFEFQLTKQNKLWRINKILYDEEDISSSGDSYQIIHYSHKPDMSAMSVLIYFTFEGGKYLLNFSFGKVGTATELKPTDVIYNYFFGKGVKVKWDQAKEIPVVLCDIQYQSLSRSLTSGMNLWKSNLEGRLHYSIQESKTCPPFSDVNIHGVYFVDDWIEIAGESGTLGATVITANLSSLTIFDTDIVYLKGEVKEALELVGYGSLVDSPDYYEMPEVEKMFRDLSAHEFGHFLGLHHIFDGTPSIMSYDEGHNGKLHSYDIKAIQELYPLM